MLLLGLPDRFIDHGDPARLLASVGWTRQASRAVRRALRSVKSQKPYEVRDLYNIPDVQSDRDSRKLAIDKVGIKAIRHPVKIQERLDGAPARCSTRSRLFNMYVGLPHHFKGTHMSRFVEILEAHEREITVETFQVMLREMVEKLEAEEGHIEMSFPYFIEKGAGLGVKSLMDYESFTGEVRKGEQRFTMKVVVPVTSLCPCSKRISERGAHNQRS